MNKNKVFFYLLLSVITGLASVGFGTFMAWACGYNNALGSIVSFIFLFSSCFLLLERIQKSKSETVKVSSCLALGAISLLLVYGCFFQMEKNTIRQSFVQNQVEKLDLLFKDIKHVDYKAMEVSNIAEIAWPVWAKIESREERDGFYSGVAGKGGLYTIMDNIKSNLLVYSNYEHAYIEGRQKLRQKLSKVKDSAQEYEQGSLIDVQQLAWAMMGILQNHDFVKKSAKNLNNPNKALYYDDLTAQLDSIINNGGKFRQRAINLWRDDYILVISDINNNVDKINRLVKLRLESSANFDKSIFEQLIPYLKINLSFTNLWLIFLCFGVLSTLAMLSVSKDEENENAFPTLTQPDSDENVTAKDAKTSTDDVSSVVKSSTSVSS